MKNGVAFPVDVFVRHVAPYAFDSLVEALSVMLVCRKAHASSHELWFWAPFLEEQRRDLVASIEDHERRAMFAKLYARADPSFFGWTAKQYVQSRLVYAAQGYRSHEGNVWRSAWEEGQLIQGLWVNGECEDYSVYCWTGRMDVCRLLGDNIDGGGVPTKRCQYEWICGLRFVGVQTIGFQRQGYGVFTLADGAQISGEWKNNVCERAHITFPPGDPRKEMWSLVQPGDGYCFEVEINLPMLVLPGLGWGVSQRLGVLEELL
jgi:hypothetical protein